MPAKVQLKDIVDALDMQLDEHSSYLDLDTGELLTVPDDLLGDAEESDEGEGRDLSDWEEEQWEDAKRIAKSDRIVALPTKFDVHEWEIMKNFANSLDSSKIRDQLLHAIHGSGAFRMFKDTIRRHNIESQWFDYREEALKEIAIEWCEEHNLSYE